MLTNSPLARRQHGLSKSRITAFEQCPKRLWLSVHRPELSEVDPHSQARFDGGHEAGAAACALHSDGVMIEAEPDLAAAVMRTKSLIDNGHDRPIFEATFVHDQVLVRVDVMTPAGLGSWHVAEVKSSTSVKDYHVGDLATQIWVLTNAGVKVASASIQHIDSSFVLTAMGDHRGLFADVCLDHEIRPTIATRADTVAAARAVLAGSEPDKQTGDHCNAPFACDFSGYCRSQEPTGPEWPIALLPHTGRKVAAAWGAQGIHDLRGVPEGGLANVLHNRIHQATLHNAVFHDRDGANAATRNWRFPRAYLDFETIAFVVPRWIGTRPYQAVPFQFSCDVEDDNGVIRHSEFLSLDGSDPRRACALALIQSLGGSAGAIVAYNASFERRCLTDLAAACPDLAEPLIEIAGRLVDLLPVTRAHYYHRDQRGSWSIKAVLPTVAAELDYANLEVKDGGNAQSAYLEAIAQTTDEPRRSAIRAALLSYCARDTQAMVVLLQRLTRG